MHVPCFQPASLSPMNFTNPSSRLQMIFRHSISEQLVGPHSELRASFRPISDQLDRSAATVRCNVSISLRPYNTMRDDPSPWRGRCRRFSG
jgi:hypothetical protein